MLAGSIASACAGNANAGPAPEYLNRDFRIEFGDTLENHISGNKSHNGIVTCYTDALPSVEINQNKTVVVFDSKVACNPSANNRNGNPMSDLGLETGRDYEDLILATNYNVTVVNQ